MFGIENHIKAEILNDTCFLMNEFIHYEDVDYGIDSLYDSFNIDHFSIFYIIYKHYSERFSLFKDDMYFNLLFNEKNLNEFYKIIKEPEFLNILSKKFFENNEILSITPEGIKSKILSGKNVFQNISYFVKLKNPILNYNQTKEKFLTELQDINEFLSQYQLSKSLQTFRKKNYKITDFDIKILSENRVFLSFNAPKEFDIIKYRKHYMMINFKTQKDYISYKILLTIQK